MTTVIIPLKLLSIMLLSLGFIYMLRRCVWLMPLVIGLFPISSQAYPTSPQINKLAQRICKLPSQSPEQFQQTMIGEMTQEMGGWLSQGSLTMAEMKDEQTMVRVGTEVAYKMSEICPSRIMEIGNQLNRGTF